MSSKIQTLHPDPTKKGTSIDLKKYNTIRAEIESIVSNGKPIKPMDLFEEVAQRAGKSFDGSATWYAVTVKLDLEARGILVHDRKKGEVRLA